MQSIAVHNSIIYAVAVLAVACMQICYVPVWMHVDMQTRIYAFLRAVRYACMHARLCLCMPVCKQTCALTDMYAYAHQDRFECMELCICSMQMAIWLSVNGFNFEAVL